MKKSFLIVMCMVFFSCRQEEKKPQSDIPEIATAEKGQQLFEANNCAACHYPDQKVVGPSLQQIANTYQAKKGDMVAFLKEEAQPIVEPDLYPTMKINIQLTKNMSDTELQSIQLYLLAQAK